MNILITGSSGMIGTALRPFLTAAAHNVYPLRRTRTTPTAPYWEPDSGNMDLASLPPVDAVIHLAGENISTGRWNSRKKQRIRESRVNSTGLICRYFAEQDRKPRVIISGSALGFYGDRAAEELDERTAPGTGFLSEVCQDWEMAVEPALTAGIRVVNIRLGVVLASHDGALKKMLSPFRMGVGGVLGSGNQYMSWITLEDVCRSIAFLLDRSDISGPVNLAAPSPVTNRAFTKALGRALKRPAVFPVPAFVIGILFGEMGRALLLSSSRAIPRKLLNAGFEFAQSGIDAALQALLKKK